MHRKRRIKPNSEVAVAVAVADSFSRVERVYTFGERVMTRLLQGDNRGGR
jgi:hypothetical protein